MSSAARIEELQKKFDENPRRYFAPLANECRKAGDLDAAIAICRTHLPQQPGHMSGHIVYGQALFESGELDEARTVFETALGLDPENLIALRHMGDIAAAHGDLGAARQWYMRVLETDPRNEEIQSLVAGLGEPQGAPAFGEQGGPAFGEQGAPAFGEQSAPALDESFGDPSGDADDMPRVRGGLPTLVDPALLAAAADAVPDGGVEGYEEPEAGASEPFEPELLDFDQPIGDTGRLATTEVEAASAVDTPRDAHLEPTAFEFEAPAMDSATLEGLEATTLDAPAAGDFATFERVGDEALLDDVDTSGSRLEGLESAEFDASGYGGSGLEPIAAPSFDFEPVDASPLHNPPDASDMPDVSDPIAASLAASDAPPRPEAFVTETMAELYVRQGYREEALGVYRKLVSQSPDDWALRSRMERLEGELAAEAAPAGGPAPDAMEADGDDIIAGLPRAIEPALVAAAAEAEMEGAESQTAVSGGPTIREFLASLATGGPLASQLPEGEIAEVVDLDEFEVTDGGYDDPETGPGADARGSAPEASASSFEPFEPESAVAAFAESEPEEEVSEVEAFEAEAPLPQFEPLEPNAAAPSVAGSGGAGLDSLFGAPDAEDSQAADVLAAAYLPQPDAREPVPAEPAADPLRGRPARPAGNDLSLDHVFGAPRQQGSPRNTGGFSFDQFFAEGAVKPAREDTPEPPAAGGDEEDLEKFNSWLHNLRKQ